jgi:hypothetical protein
LLYLCCVTQAGQGKWDILKAVFTLANLGDSDMPVTIDLALATFGGAT